jgi:hypothetical protein
MSDLDRERCLSELHEHQTQIVSLTSSLEELARDEASRNLTRHIAYVTAQVMRHRISVALLQSRLASSMRITAPAISST